MRFLSCFRAITGVTNLSMDSQTLQRFNQRLIELSEHTIASHCTTRPEPHSMIPQQINRGTVESVTTNTRKQRITVVLNCYPFTTDRLARAIHNRLTRHLKWLFENYQIVIRGNNYDDGSVERLI